MLILLIFNRDTWDLNVFDGDIVEIWTRETWGTIYKIYLGVCNLEFVGFNRKTTNIEFKMGDWNKKSGGFSPKSRMIYSWDTLW